jgi:O-antigen ligase
MWLDQPLFGHGFRSYKILAPAYGDQVLGSPHNEWLRLFAEEGIVAGILGIAFVLAVAWRLARIPGWLAAGALGAFVGWAITATFNNPFLFLQVNAIAFTIAGITLGLGRSPAPIATAALTDAPASADEPPTSAETGAAAPAPADDDSPAGDATPASEPSAVETLGEAAAPDASPTDASPTDPEEPT